MTKKKPKMKVDNQGIHEVSVDLPGNSKKSKEKPEIKRITKGEVKRQKKSVGKKVSESLFKDTLGNVASYMIQDVLVPAAKDTLYDLVNGGLAVMLWGEMKNNRNKRSGIYNSTSRVNYGSFSRGPAPQTKPVEKRQPLSYNNIMDDLFFEFRGDAELTLETLQALLDEYDMVSVAELNDLIGVTGEFVDHDRGWTNLADSKVSRVRGGYLLVLPPVMKLN